MTDAQVTLSDRGRLEQACIEVVGPWFDESHEKGLFNPMGLAQRILRAYDAAASVPLPVDGLPHCQLCGSAPVNEEHAVETQRRWKALAAFPAPAPLHGHNYGGDWIECTDDHPSVPLPVDGLPARLIDGDDSGNDPGHDLQTDDPGDGSGPAFCICNRWNDGEGITFGQHIENEYAALAASPAPAPLDVERLACAIHHGMNTISCMGAFHSCINRGQHERSAQIALARLQSEPTDPEPGA